MIIAILIALLPVAAQGQLKKQDPKKIDFAKVLTAPGSPQGLFGLLGLNPSRFSMQQSYTLSFGSLGGQSFSQGIYLNTMQYQLSDPLRVYVQWGMFNQPFAAFGASPLTPNRLFLSSAGVSFKPTDNMSIEVQYNSMPYRYYYYVPSTGLSRWRTNPNP
jgi:hypothetical protein